MSFLDKLSERVGGFLDEVFLPEDVAHSLHKASQAMQREDYDAALRILYRTHAEHPDFHRTHHMIGMCHFHQEKFDEALSAFDRAIEQREEAVSHLYAGLSAEQLGHAHEAQVHFRRGLELSDADELKFDLLFGLGRAYLAQSRADKAVRELKKAVKDRPDQSEAAVLLARALLQRGKLDEAREVLESPAARSAGQPALILRGEIEEARGQNKQAREAYEKALEWEPDHLSALVGASRTSLALGDHRHANEYLLRALEGADDERLPEIHTLLGQVNEAVENEQRALECYRNALHLDTRRPQAHLGAGQILLARGDVDTAREHFQAVLESVTDDPPTRRKAMVGWAQTNLAGGDLAGARRLIDEVLQEVDEPSPEALHLLGRVALESGDAAEAVVAFEEAMRAAGERRVDMVENDLRRALDELTFDWKLPDRLDDSTDVVEVLRQLRDFVASDPRIDGFAPRVQQMLATLNAPLSVAIVGEFNAGKSTLLNALIGEEVVPMGVLPTTAHTCFIQYGPRKAARVVRKDGEVVEVNLEEAKRQMKTDAEGIDHLEYVYPHPDLRSVEFWDTPGFNALQDAHEETASRALEEAEAILWVLDANQALSHSEFELIENVPDGRERLLVLLNKIDRLGPADSRAPQVKELVDYIDENAGGRIAGSFPMTAKEALAQRTQPEGERDEAALSQTGFTEFRTFLESRIIERSGRIKTLEIARQLRDLVANLTDFQRDLVDKYEELGNEAVALRGWLDELSEERPEKRAKKEARALEDRFDFVLTGIEREIREALKSRGTWLTRKVLSEEDQTFILDLLSERLDDVLDRSRQQILADIDELEGEVAQRVGPIIQALPLGEARAMNRRLEGFFDETRMLKLLLEERVYGQLRARATGQIEVAGQRALEEIRNSGQEQGPAWRASLRRLLPDTRTHLNRELAAWYREFFLAACRFSDRVQRDLHLLKLEAEHHFDVSALHQMADT